MEHDKAEKEWMSSQRERDSATPGVGKPPNGSGNATPNGRVEEVGATRGLSDGV